MTGSTIKPARIRTAGILVIYSVVLVATLIIQLLPHEWQETLKYDRHTLATTIWWVWLTAHLLHLGWVHLLLNLAGLGVVFILFHDVWSYFRLTLTFILTAALVTLALWFFSPEIIWYVGLSGVLHGLLTAGALLSFKQTPGISVAVLAVVVFKSAYEQFTGYASGYLEASINGMVVIDAHLYGVVSGLIAAVLLLFLEVEKPG